MMKIAKITFSAIELELFEAELETLGYETARRLQKEAVLRAMDKHTRYNTKNRAFRRLQQAARRASKAAPKWLTEEQRAQMQSIYDEAEKRSALTDVRHDVDHIVPLNGVCPFTGVPNVCGLHVPWNLRAIPHSLNKMRGNAYYSGWPPLEYDDGDDDIPW